VSDDWEDERIGADVPDDAADLDLEPDEDDVDDAEDQS
jgi:hypothetical protein